MSRISRTNMSAGGRCRRDPAASRPPLVPATTSEAVTQLWSCFVVTCALDSLDHLVPDKETGAPATGERYWLEALCGWRVIPGQDPALHRGIPCERCHARAAAYDPPLIIRGRAPVHIIVPDIYVLLRCGLDHHPHLVPEREWQDAGDSVTLQALGAHEMHPDGGPLACCVELCGDCLVAWPGTTAPRPSPTGPLLYRGGSR